MKVASFTQTYGDKRILELLLLKYDVIGNEFRNKCDYIIFSFHNCSNYMIKKGSKVLTELYPKNKLILLTYNNISYLESIRRNVAFIKGKGVDYILQIQDDQHGINSIENVKQKTDINDAFIFLKEKKPDLLHIFCTEGNPVNNGIVPLEINEFGNTKFYCYDSRSFKEKNIYSWNDGTYFAKTDFLQKLFNMNMPEDVWRIELTLKSLFDDNKFLRWGCNKLYFRASNLHGRNVNSVMTVEENLGRFFGELEAWNEIKKVIAEFM